jgi:hypothetical protein
LSSKLRISKNILAPTDAWKEIYNNCDYATYFHSVDFAQSVVAYMPQIKIASRYIEFSDHKKAVFILFKQFAFKGLLTSYVSSIFGVYGGWVSADTLNEVHYSLLTSWILKSNIFIRFNPYQTPVYDKLNIKPENTQRLNLKTGYENLYKNYDYRHKHAIKKAIEKGVTIVKANTLQDWKTYYEVYSDSIRRWGDKTRSVYQWPLFESFFNNKTGNINLHLAIYADKIVAGAICFNSKNKILYWHGSYLEEFKNVNPATYLIADIIKNSAGTYDYFDFLPSGGLKGVLFFKNGYGPDEVLTPTFANYTLKYRALNKFFKLMSKVYHKFIRFS